MRHFSAGVSLLTLLALVGCASALPEPIPTATSGATPTSVLAPTLIPSPVTPTVEPTIPALDLPGVIAFTRLGEGSVNIHTIRPDGTQQTPLTDDAGASYLPMWSPDGLQIAYYYYDPAPQEIGIRVVEVATGEVRVVPIEPIDPSSLMRWSADSRYVLFAENRPSGNPEIVRVDITSGEMISLTDESDAWHQFPSFSPAGGRIAFASDRDGFDDIWRMNIDGGDPINLTADATEWEDVTPAWSPDGGLIAWYRWSFLEDTITSGGPAGLWIMNTDGSQARVLADFSALQHSDLPAWSPDGSRIAYTAPGIPESDVWVVTVATGETVRISELSGEEREITWSPDGRALIFTNIQGDVRTLFLALADGSLLVELVGGGEGAHGQWSP